MLSAQDHDRIRTAVAAAEDGTSGDIFCVLAGEVSSYREVPIAWGAIAALLIPPLVLAFALGPLVTAITGGGWTGVEASGLQSDLAIALTGYAALQLALFAVVALAASIGPVRRAVTPRFLKRHRVKKAAFHHFAAAHSHAKDSETGVLIFVALVERQVEILADAAIHAKCGEAPWQEAAKAVREGMRAPDPTAGVERAVAICGEALKAHFPSSATRAQPDRPMDI